MNLENGPEKRPDKIYDCAIIGGGAAGMMCAISVRKQGASVIVIEHTNKVGNKILQTGNGKCNFTNLVMEPDCYQNPQKDFVMSVIAQFDEKKTMEFFETLGVYSKARNGYVYPHSETAASVQNAMRIKLEQEKVKVTTDFETKTLQYCNGRYEIAGASYTYYARTVVLATGSMAAPKSGSDGSGYALAKAFGHDIVKPLPALVQLISHNKECPMMAGVRSYGEARLFINEEEICKEIGEIQYTEYGLSGIPIFQMSRHGVKALEEKKKVTIVINMLPDYGEQELKDICQRGMEHYPNKNVEQFFEGILHKKLLSATGKALGVDMNKKASDLGVEKMTEFILKLTQYSFAITGNKDFHFAQVCQGGVRLAQVEERTLMSKLQSGLFFAGELLDVDGKCGGYNLQWAWSSGYVAAKGVTAYLEEERG